MTARTYSAERQRLIGVVLSSPAETLVRAYDLLDTRYRVLSLHDLTDEQLRELVTALLTEARS